MPTPSPSASADLVSGLSEIVGRSHVLVDPATTEGYRTDWTGSWRTGDAIVVRPANVDQVAAVLRLCGDLGATVTPQGGNTGLVGGSQPEAGQGRPAVIMSLRRLDDVGAVDEVNLCVGVGAGATLSAVHHAAAAAGLAFGVDLAARDSATIGGMVATNAGGIAMIRHGNMRAQVLGMEAVLASGEILVRWRPLRKDNVGYDLPGLLAGSEGTLAVITRVLLRLVMPPPRTAVGLVGVDSVADALRIVGSIERQGTSLEAVELMTADGVELATADTPAGNPIAEKSRFVLLVEVAEDPEGLADALAHLDGVVDAVIEEGPARRLWEVRERHTEAIAASTTTPIVKLDVSVPLGVLGDLMVDVTELARQIPARPVLFGHVGDGNVHVNLLDVPTGKREAVTDQVLRLVDALGGSISAEHGIGRAKRNWVHLGRSASDIATMRAIRHALDPAGMLNPGALLPEGSSAAE
ncbi:FAD-binding oxidoreductase [Gordonia sp. (in: high G+C Gram-positive bacteria)]|uniref:FAD-binding oxidoreductase n=1 Tax=Gordonia sp. (in: high G+C Gram-positive bacteria) TaxID=84139 RepID=UPI003C75D360